MLSFPWLNKYSLLPEQTKYKNKQSFARFSPDKIILPIKDKAICIIATQLVEIPNS